MFTLRPNALWKTQGIGPLTAAPDGKRPMNRFLRLTPYRSLLAAKGSRRASDQLGLRPQPAASSDPFFVTTPQQQAQPGRLVIDYTGDDWISPEENRQLIELNDSADLLMSDLAQSDRDLAALACQTGRGAVSADLSLTAQQTFARIDALMLRWNLRAEEVERSNSGTQWVAFNPLTGNRYAAMPAMRRDQARTSRIPSGPVKGTAPQRGAPAAARAGDQRQMSKAEFSARPAAPAVQIRQRRQRLFERQNASNGEKLSSLREQINRMAAAPAEFLGRTSGLRRIALARLANLHETIDHMAHELHQYRQHVENSIHQRLDRRRTPRHAGPPPPVLKPKTKGETTA